MRSIMKINLILCLAYILFTNIDSLSILAIPVPIRLPKMSKCDSENLEKCKQKCESQNNSKMCFCFQYEGKKDIKCACKHEKYGCPRF